MGTELSDEQLDKIDDDFVLHHMAPRGRESVRGFARAVIAADRAVRPESVDALRLDWLEQHDGRFYNLDRITSVVGKGFNEHKTLREAIDAAIAKGEQT